MNRRPLARILFALALVGCGEEAVTPDAGNGDAGPRDAGGELDAGPREDAGHDAGPPAATLTIERWGDRLYGRVLAMRRIDRELWIGTSAVIDPSLGDTSPVRSALARLDLDSGAVRVFEAELPRFPYDVLEGPTPTSVVVADGTRRLAASRAGILAIDGDVITLHTISVGGTNAAPTHLAIDRDHDRLWASTNLGLVELDRATFAVRSTVVLDGMPGSLAVDPATGALYAAVHPEAAPSTVVRVLDGARTTLTPGLDGAPGGAVGDIVWSSAHGAAFIALASWDPASGGVIAWDGTTARSIVSEHDLSLASRGESIAFGASTLGYDEGAGVLVVGGRIRSVGIGFLEGGGLAWIDVSDLSRPGLAGLSTSTSEVRGNDVTAAAYDPVDHRTYVALQEPCNEYRIGNVGIHAIAFERGLPRFEVPILSGVRDLERVDGQLWIGLRDDNGGIACDGVEVQTGFMRVHGDRAGVVPSIRSGVEGWTAARAPTTELAFRSLDRRAFTGFRSELFIGGDTGLLLNPAIDIGTSLWPEDLAWQDDRTLWIASRTSHSPGDPEIVANTGPRGAARVVLNDAGAIASITQYVRQNRDPSPTVIEGLPSAEVYDVVIDTAGNVHLVCGIERLIGTYDRLPRDEFRLGGQYRAGGVARIEADGSITIVAGPAIVPDGRAGAFAPDGTLYVLDAMRGLLRQTATGFEVVELAEVPSGAIGQTLWIGEGGDLVVGYDRGALVRIGDQSRFVDDVGFVWSVDASGDVLLLGTDRGLVRVIPEGIADAGEAAPLPSELPPFAGIEPPPPPTDGGVPSDAGMCLAVGQVCGRDPTPCCPGSVCASAGIVLTCEAL